MGSILLTFYLLPDQLSEYSNGRPTHVSCLEANVQLETERNMLLQPDSLLSQQSVIS